MNARWTRVVIASLIAAAVAGCGSDDPAPPVLSVDANGVSTVDAAALDARLSGVPPESPLSAAERASLLFMREEEQLAHDVYAALQPKYAQPIFGNIAASETTHAGAVATLLARHGIADPMAGKAPGTFASPAFGALHDALVAAGGAGLLEALKVGVEIEELDIRDIEAQKVDVDNADILTVYDQLLKGSRNHLRSFMSVLVRQGGSYSPKYVTQAAFDAIVGSAMETGR